MGTNGRDIEFDIERRRGKGLREVYSDLEREREGKGERERGVIRE